MILNKAYLGFPAGTILKQVEVQESPPNQTRCLVTGSDETTVEFWCPDECISHDEIHLSEEYQDEEADLALHAADLLLQAKPRTRQEVAHVIQDAYGAAFVDAQVRLHDETRLRNKWRAAWILSNRRADALQKRLNELATPVQPADAIADEDHHPLDRSAMKQSLRNILRVLKDCKLAQADMQHDGVEG